MKKIFLLLSFSHYVSSLLHFVITIVVVVVVIIVTLHLFLCRHHYNHLDGSCLIANIDGRKLIECCRLRDGHDAAVASVIFPQFGPSSSLCQSFSHVTADDRLMVSAGNDGSILLWDLGSNVAGDDAVDPTSMFLDRGKTDNSSDGGDISSAVKGLSVSKDNDQPKVIFGIPHGRKINWMVSSSGHDLALSNSLFVADVGNNISVYTLPRD